MEFSGHDQGTSRYFEIEGNSPTRGIQRKDFGNLRRFLQLDADVLAVSLHVKRIQLAIPIALDRIGHPWMRVEVNDPIACGQQEQSGGGEYDPFPGIFQGHVPFFLQSTIDPSVEHGNCPAICAWVGIPERLEQH